MSYRCKDIEKKFKNPSSADFTEHIVVTCQVIMITNNIAVILLGCTQIPISTLSHIWVFVRLYGIVFVIIVIIIIIIMIIKSEGVNAQL